jgi:hypothetical protein
MKELVRFLTERPIEKLRIDLSDLRVLMRSADLRSFIVPVKTGNSFFPHLVGGTVGLTAPGNTAAAAGHHFDKVIGRLPSLFLRLPDFP